MSTTQPYAEFEEAEWYDPWPAPPIPGHTLDPWRCDTRGVLLVPRHIVEAIVQPEWMANVERNEMGSCMDTRADIAVHGLKTPLEIVFDGRGKIILRHGHHRTVATRGWAHFDLLPIRLTESNGITVNRAPNLRTFLPELLFSSVRP